MTTVDSVCPWALKNPLEREYHDTEWGVPKYDESVLFECLCLEAMQSGLSWYTVLSKRDNYRQAFFQFDIEQVACMCDEDVSKLMQNSGLIRHQKKLESLINNAKKCMELKQKGIDLTSFFWSFVGGETKQNAWICAHEVPTSTPESEYMAKTLKSLGFKFLGPTTCYSFMQATGMVNDHLVDCSSYQRCIESNT